MGTLDIIGFAESAESFALKVDSAALPGLLRRTLTVPPGCVAWVRDEDGREAVLAAGERRAGTFTGVLAKTAEMAVSFQIDALPCSEGHAVTAGIEVVLEVVPRAIELKVLLESLLRDRAEVRTQDLRAALLPHLRAALAYFIGARASEALAKEDLRLALDAHLRGELRQAAFQAGIDVKEARHPSFFCEEYERRRAREAEALERARFTELKAELEKNEVLKKREVEELARALQVEGVLKDMAQKTEFDKRRKDDDLKRYEALYEKLGKDDVKALIFLLEDETLKAELIKSLVERGMTEEQIRARRANDADAKLLARVEELSAKLAALSGARERRIAAGGASTRRVLGAYGKAVVAFDPASAERRVGPVEVYDFEARGLGYLRSVKTVVTREGPVVLAGAQRGVYVVKEGDSKSVRELRFRKDPSGQGGVNACAYFDGHVYATHSELGVSRFDTWLGKQEPLFEMVTAHNESTRGAYVTPDGMLFFASGSVIYRANLMHPNQELTSFRGAGDSITTLVTTATEVIAGTRDGRILRWSATDPSAPRELHIRKSEAIYMLKIAELDGRDHLLVGAKDHGITAVSLETGRALDYRSKDQIRWVDGASDLVFGVSRSGYVIHVWEAGRPEAEAFELRVADRLQDIFVQKERAPSPVTA